MKDDTNSRVVPTSGLPGTIVGVGVGVALGAVVVVGVGAMPGMLVGLGTAVGEGVAVGTGVAVGLGTGVAADVGMGVGESSGWPQPTASAARRRSGRTASRALRVIAIL